MPLKSLKPRSDSAIIRNKLDEIEAALGRGASRQAVWETLQKENGLTIGFTGFCQALLRARRRNKAVSPSGDQKAPGGVVELDCTIQNTDAASQPKEAPVLPRKTDSPPDRIMTAKDFSKVHEMDFSNFGDEKYK